MPTLPTQWELIEFPVLFHALPRDPGETASIRHIYLRAVL